ncbi:Uncharacterised protein [Yersinia enterocolitica]|nr:Uncharacterised protein [Yersinia enterocolitica]CQI01873.1 Uncharacterised protein [Yersinia enterocolitica]
MLSIIYEQRELVKDLCNSSVFITDQSQRLYYNLLDYVEEHIDSDIYTIPLLRQAIRTDNNNDLLKVVQFFSGGGSGLFDIKYCYENENREYSEIPTEEYNNYILKNIDPVDTNGKEIEDFNPKYLSFYCLLNVG